MVQIEYPVINMTATGKRIRELRQAKGITVRELSEYMGFTEPQAVYKWQRGDSLPTVDNLLALSRILGTTMEDILIGDDGMSFPFLLEIEPAVYFQKAGNGYNVKYIVSGKSVP